MIKEDFVSSETSKLLKEKGFNEDSWFHYDTDGDIVTRGYRLNHPDDIPAWTHQRIMKWLRELHNICISVDVKIGGGKYYVCISSTENGLSYGVLEDEVWDTFEEACEESIKYCLENLL